MPNNISTYLADDAYKPQVPKPDLQQYDNYQIYDISCVDRVINITDFDGITKQEPIKQTSFIAVQAYDVNPIKFDFNAIINQYK